jgi:DNA-3-methyladenine glycosylase I
MDDNRVGLCVQAKLRAAKHCATTLTRAVGGDIIRYMATSYCWGEVSDLMAAYHDSEWGVPVHDDQRLFEILLLDNAQAGLSWETILQRRPNYRKAFAGFDPQRVARFTPRDVQRLLKDPGIIRNRLKIESAITNARCFLEIQEEFGSFDAFIWQFVQGRPIRGRWKTWRDVPATTPESDAMSKELKRRGFKFVGSTICYAIMQTAGLVNDHILGCPRRAVCG